MAKMTVHVDALNLDKVKQVFQVLKDVSVDESVPIKVREEILNKVGSILESDRQC